MDLTQVLIKKKIVFAYHLHFAKRLRNEVRFNTPNCTPGLEKNHQKNIRLTFKKD